MKATKWAIFGILLLLLIALIVILIVWLVAYVDYDSNYECSKPGVQPPSRDPCDAVITWVDSSDPEWRRCRERCEGRISQSSYETRRFGSNNISQIEIECSVKCLLKNAPWLRTIWIATHRPQVPNFYKNLSFMQKRKVKIIHHDEFFGCKSNQLPVFNSHAIEANLWKIPGLANKWLQLNDDFMITSPTTEDLFYCGDRPLIRLNKVLNVRDCGFIGPLVCKFRKDSKVFLESTANISAYYGNNKFIPRHIHHSCAMTRDMFKNSRINEFEYCRTRASCEIPPIHFVVLEALKSRKALKCDDKYSCLFTESLVEKDILECDKYMEICVNYIRSYEDAIKMKNAFGF